jgi:CubicO group peptidase (beta-lactamase class C family)
MKVMIRTIVPLLVAATSLAQVDIGDHPVNLAAGEFVATQGSLTRTARAEDRKGATGASTSKANVRADRVDAVIRAEMSKRHIPGASVVVVRRDKVALARGYGLANLELSVPATPDSVFQIASVTKPFVAMAILMLVEEGKVRLDEDIRTHVSGLPDAWSGITVRHLLSHTSGIKDYMDQLRMWSLREDIAPPGIVQKVAREPLNFRPGEKVRYSNTNYILLGMVIEQVSGKPWEMFLAERIFEPLGMTNTHRYHPAEIIPNRASPYEWLEGKMRNTGHLNRTLWFNADGGLISTVRDLAKWDAALGTGKLLKKSSLKQMWTPAKLADGKAAIIGDNGAGKPNHYGLGWYLSDYRGHRIVLHGGDKPGFSATFIRFVDDELTVVVLCNSQAGNPAHGMALVFADLYLSDPDRPTER